MEARPKTLKKKPEGSLYDKGNISYQYGKNGLVNK